MANTQKIRRFTKTDWYGYAGAEKFENGSNPYIYTKAMNDGLVELIIIADRHGIEVYLTSEEGQDEELIITTDAWKKLIELSAMRAEGEMARLVKYIEEFDYAPNLAYELDHPSDECVEGFEYYGEN